MACCCKGGLLQSSLQAGVAQIKCRGWRVVLLQHEEGYLNWIKFQICLFLVRDFVDVDNLLIFSGDLDFIWVTVVPHLECGQAEWHIK
jgi:hypothetical protein